MLGHHRGLFIYCTNITGVNYVSKFDDIPKGCKHYGSCIHFKRTRAGYTFSLDFKVFPTLRALRNWDMENTNKPNKKTFAFYTAESTLWKRDTCPGYETSVGYVAYVANSPAWHTAHESLHIMFELCRQFHPNKLVMVSKSVDHTRYEESMCDLVEAICRVSLSEISEAKKFFRSRGIEYETQDSPSYQDYLDSWPNR